eukprot:gene47268-63349_t
MHQSGAQLAETMAGKQQSRLSGDDHSTEDALLPNRDLSHDNALSFGSRSDHEIVAEDFLLSRDPSRNSTLSAG